MDAHEDAAGLASWLREAREQLTTAGGFSARYAAADVDAFLSDVAEDLGRGALPDSEYLRNVKFGVTRFGRGYLAREIDELIRGLQQRLFEATGAGISDSSDMDPMIARISNAQFRTTRTDGYDQREVDDFLDEVVEALRRCERAAPPPVFTTTRRRPGYNKQDVDALMSEIGRVP
jgi:DivIVA domain-containing protein